MAEGLARGQIRLCNLATPDKTRPVLILTRPALVGALATVVVAPITSTVRRIPTQVMLDTTDGLKGACAVNLAALYSVRKETLGRLVASLSEQRMSEVCRAACMSLGCDSVA